MNTRVLAMVEGAVAAALGAVLSVLIVYRLPQGGSVTLASVVPIWVVSLRHGAKAGALAGAALGALNFLQNPQLFHPLQPVLDYPLAFAMLGLAGLWPERPVVGAMLGSLGKVAVHTLSGCLFFASYAAGTGKSVVLYAVTYNLTTGVPDLAAALVVFGLLRSQAPHLVRRVTVGSSTEPHGEEKSCGK